jgi:UDP-glucose 4-epimerase
MEVRLNVLVTGGLGKVGRHVAAALRQARHRVTITDIAPASYGIRSRGSLPYLRADLTDFGQAVSVIAQVRPDMVVHTAAIPDGQHDAGPVIFATNTTAMFNVTEAVYRLGVRRPISMSSETVLGFIAADRPWLPDYLPVDENHPRRPQEAYAVSKAISEDLCDALVRRSTTTAVSIRPSFVIAPDEYVRMIPQLQSISGPTFNHWSYTDAEDSAELTVLAAQSDTPGHTVVYAAQPDNWRGADFTQLVADAFGADAPPIRVLGRSDASGINSAKATELFGWRPKHSWRTRLAEAGDR